MNSNIVKTQSPFGDDFLLMNRQPVLANTLTDHVDDYRVLIVIISKVGYGNHAAINQTEVAEYLGMKRPHVCRAIKRLKTAGVITEKGKAESGCKIYTLNPEMFWRGSPEQHRSALRRNTETASKLRVVDGGIQ